MILHPVAAARKGDQQATDVWLAARSDVWTVICDRASVYPDELHRAWSWGADQLVVIEHDIVPREETVDEFARCPHPFCTSPYWLFGGHVSLLDPTTRVALGGSPESWAGAGPRLRVLSGLGCVRFRRRERLAVDTRSFAGDYDGLDERVSRAILAAGYGWHVHRPVQTHTGRP